MRLREIGFRLAMDGFLPKEGGLWQPSEDTPRSVGDLGLALGMDNGTLTPLLKRLEAAGLVTRTRDLADERRVLVDLTRAGQALREKACSVPERALAT